MKILLSPPSPSKPRHLSHLESSITVVPSCSTICTSSNTSSDDGNDTDADDAGAPPAITPSSDDAYDGDADGVGAAAATTTADKMDVMTIPKAMWDQLMTRFDSMEAELTTTKNHIQVSSAPDVATTNVLKAMARRIHSLEKKLDATETKLQATMEALDASNQELKSLKSLMDDTTTQQQLADDDARVDKAVANERVRSNQSLGAMQAKLDEAMGSMHSKMNNFLLLTKDGVNCDCYHQVRAMAVMNSAELDVVNEEIKAVRLRKHKVLSKPPQPAYMDKLDYKKYPFYGFPSTSDNARIYEERVAAHKNALADCEEELQGLREKRQVLMGIRDDHAVVWSDVRREFDRMRNAFTRELDCLRLRLYQMISIYDYPRIPQIRFDIAAALTDQDRKRANYDVYL